MSLLALGRFDAEDHAALKSELGLTPLANLAALEALPLAERQEVTGLAVKSGERFDGAAMDLLPNLRVLAKYGVGYETIDVEAASARGIRVTNTPDVLNDDVADLAVLLWLGVLREAPKAEHHARSGAWLKGPAPLARKANGRRVGILGLGRIGREIADRLAAFKCEIHYCTRTPRDLPGWRWHGDAKALAAAVDDLIIATPGGESTAGLVSAKVLTALGPEGVVVNISRGSVIDEEALIAALETRQIAGAGLDVFQGEPQINPRLLAAPGLMALPHIGSATHETRRAMGALQRANLRAFLEGKPLLTPVN